MLDRRLLRLLMSVAAVNGLVCIVAPTVVIVRHGGAHAQVGHFIYVAAVLVLALTPLQLVTLWLVLRPRLLEILDRRQIEARVARVLDRQLLETAFQPIMNMASHTIVGVEALSRFTATPYSPPNEWFSQAERIGRGAELELLAIRKALDAARRLPEHLSVAVNASPSLVMSGELLPVLLCAPIPPQRIVVEVTEHASVEDYPPLLQARDRLRERGIRVAIDDAGSGYSSFRHIVALAPDIIKIDRALITGIDHDGARRAMIACLVLYALESGSLIVGEGVETPAELDTLDLLGVDAAQGYLLGRPTTRPEDWATWREQNTPVSSPGRTDPARPAPPVLDEVDPFR
jgi:EAL domain-containing protein (putative c-di-GMP-specific phosphodiesterase class I)